MKIITKPLAGLANKLRVIESVVSLAKDVRHPVEVVWVTDWQMVAQYRDLFEPSELFELTDHNRYKYCRSSFTLSSYKKPVSRVINFAYGIDVAFNELDIQKLGRQNGNKISSMISNKTSYFDTCHDFYPFHYNFSWVRPVPRIADAVSSFSERLKGKKCIGLHLRRTDNVDSIKNSPDHLFEQAIREEIAKDENVIFFLATDDEATQASFVKKFGADRIAVNPKKFGRDSVTAVQDAVTDWTLLGMSKKLYCSYYSSFSETAASVSGSEAFVLKAE